MLSCGLSMSCVLEADFYVFSKKVLGQEIFLVSTETFSRNQIADK
jgi:hypothetical protein